MKKMLYMGHSYHLKTKSNRFLFDLLEQEYEIDFVSYDPYTDEYIGIEETIGRKYDVLLLWQIMPDMAFLTTNFYFEQGVLFPMYDYIASKETDLWPEFRSFKIINFCRKSHDELIKRGYRSYYIQYFPQPMEYREPGNENSVFFWQRMENININTVARLMEEQEIEHIHVHKSVDPGQEFIEPDAETEKITTYSEWFEAPEDLHRVMRQSAIYIAPRLYEGIGMSFLEAMAMGRCVIAPDTPTMNEYITDGVNGILYDLEDIHPVKIENVSQIQENARMFIENGYSKWEKDKNNILAWISEEEEQPLVTVVTVVKDALKNGRRTALAQCIESVHNQLYPRIEHLLMDGASEDGTLKILSEYQKMGWIECCSEPDSGMYEAMNKGIRKANGKYIVFLNTDDYFHDRNAVKESVFSLENSHADFSFASNRILREDGISDTVRKPDIGSFVVQMPFCHQTMFTKKSVLVEVGMFNEKYKSSADYDLVLRLILAGCRYVEVEADIVTYRNGGVSESMQKRSDLEKYDIFKCLYRSYYGNISDEFSRGLAGRICPLDFLDGLFCKIPEVLKEAVRKAIVDVDEEKKYCYFPEEIVISSSAEICDEASYRANAKNVELQKNIEREKERSIKFEREFGLLDRWLWLKLDKRDIKVYFEQRGYHSIAIYEVGEISNRFYEEMSRTSDIELKYAIDDKKQVNYPLKVYGTEDEWPKADVIVVFSINTFRKIKSDLRKKVSCPVISFEEVIFNIPEERICTAGVNDELLLELEREREANQELLRIIEESGKNLKEYGQYFNLLDRWLWLKLDNKNIKEYFRTKKYSTIAVYGTGEICNRFYEEISRTSDIEIKYVIDKESGCTHPVLKVCGIEDELEDVDAIVVALNYMYDDIKSVLEEKVDCPIISIDEVINNS